MNGSLSDSFEIRTVGKNGLLQLVEWAKAEGWNPGPCDAEVFWETDPEGFIGCFDKDEMIGGGSVVSYDGKFGFMGFFIVKPLYRSVGIGRKLWLYRRDYLLGRLQHGAPIGMDGVLAMQDFYSEGGFKTAFRSVRYSRLGERLETDVRIDPISQSEWSSIMRLDTYCFGFDREKFLKAWLSMTESRTFRFADEGGIRGFAVLRKATTGYKIGPLFADSAPVAEALYRSCLNSAPEALVFMDVPVINADAMHLVRKYKAESNFECARMYHGPAPELPIGLIYGITSFELG